MRKRVISALVGISMLASLCGVMPVSVSAAEKAPQWQTQPRRMEKLGRGLVAVKTENVSGQSESGVYLSWRLLGSESLENQKFDIYKNGTKIHTTGAHDATCYIDKSGSATDKYKVVREGEDASAEPETVPNPTNNTARADEVRKGNSLPNSYAYVDIPIDIPDDVARMGDGKTSTYRRTRYDGANIGGANDASVGDLDGDGEYEIVLKWDPQDSKDSAGADFTGNVYIDAYEIDPNNHGYKWRIDLGKNVTAGAHYTQFMVYDFDGDGKAEIAMKTAPGSIDGTGHYVSEVGDTAAIRNVDNTAQFIGTSGRQKGKNPFTQYLTVFDGETGKALYTTDFIPYEGQGRWGDDASHEFNRSERYLAAVAYIDGVHPSIVMCRGYYHNAVVRAYLWDGKKLTLQNEHNASTRKDDNIFGNGNHNLSVADIDDDGRDEIVYGSVSLDYNVDASGNVTGSKAVGNTKLGHGDAMHVNDFNNDGVQEVFSVKEDGEGFKKQAENLRVANTGKSFWADGKLVTKGDNGRGVMDNIDDAYAKAQYDAGNKAVMAIGWSSGFDNAHDMNGDDLKAKPAKAGSGSFDSFLVYWDGDLSRELLDENIIQKYDAANGWTKRFYGPNDGGTLVGGSSSNHTKRNSALVADLWGDWREEVIMAVNDGVGVTEQAALRIFTSTIPTDYRLTTLMHDNQYRMSVAWQNVAYNQPTHTSYYVGSIALAEDAGGALNYLAPAVKYTKVEEVVPEYTKQQLFTAQGFENGKQGFSGGTIAASAENAHNKTIKGTFKKDFKLTAKSNEGYQLTEADTDYIQIPSFKLNTDTKTAEIKVVNPTDADFAATVMAAGYDENNVFQSVVPVTKTVGAETEDTITAAGGAGTKFKAFMWQNLESMVPVTEALSESKKEISDVKIAVGQSVPVQAEFDWKASGTFKLAAADDTNLITFTKAEGEPVMYSTGEEAEAVLDSSLTADNAWYHVEVTINQSSKKADVVIKDITNNSKTVFADALPIAATTSLPDKIEGRSTEIDDFKLFKLVSAKERELVEFTVYDAENQAASGAQITVGSETVVTDANGRARMKVPKGEYTCTVKSVGSKTTHKTLNSADTFADIKMEETQPRDVYLAYKMGNVELKAEEVIASAKETTLCAPEISDDKKADIEHTFTAEEVAKLPAEYASYEGKTVMLEYNPDKSVTEAYVSETEKTVLTLEFEPKRVPLEGETEIANIHIAKNGTGQGTSWNMPDGAVFKSDSSGRGYVEFTDDGTNPFEIAVNNTNTSFVTELDVMMNDMTGGGDAFGVIPCSGDTQGVGAGWRRNGDGTRFEPAATSKDAYLTLTSADYKSKSNYAGKWTHIIMVYNKGNIRVSYINKDKGTVFVDNQPISQPEGSVLGENPVDKIVIGRGVGSGSATIGVRNLKMYTVNVDTEFKSETRTVDIPGTSAFTVSTNHASDIAGTKYDVSLIAGNVTYEVQSTNGTVVETLPEGASLSDKGVLTLAEGTDVSSINKIFARLDGEPWREWVLSYRQKQLITHTDTFEEGLNGFAITSGKTGYNIAHENGTVKYTKDTGIAQDAGVHLTYPITTQNLGDDFELSFDFKVVTGAFKGYMYLQNTGGGQLMRMETHLYEPRFKVPTTSGEVNFNTSSGFDTEWKTFVYKYTNGKAKIDIYNQTDTGREHPLVNTGEFDVTVNASDGAKFDFHVAQNIQNGSADKTDEYYFDNFTYKYYDYQ